LIDDRGASRSAPVVVSPIHVATNGDTPLLELRGITKSFGSVQALTDVDLVVHRG